VGFVADKVALGQAFLIALRFALPIIIPPMLHTRPSSGRGGACTVGPFDATAQNDSVSPHLKNTD
jgi:hypothetical protein